MHVISEAHIAFSALGVAAGVQEEVQLREQDFGNFQDAVGKAQEKSERLRFGRFFYRFPNGESGADVYDRCARPAAASGVQRCTVLQLLHGAERSANAGLDIVERVPASEMRRMHVTRE